MRYREISEAEPVKRFQTLAAGTLLYHGSNKQWDEQKLRPEAPFWLTDHPKIAAWFSFGGRVITYRTTRPLKLVMMTKALLRQYDAEGEGELHYAAGNLCHEASRDGFDGWITRKNAYIIGDNRGIEVMVCDGTSVEYVGTGPLKEAAGMKKMRPTAADIDYIRKMREEIRCGEGGGGYCHILADVIEDEFGWQKSGGTYCSGGDEPICSAHRWNLLPDGAILDATADQLGDDDIVIIPKGDPRHRRYRYEYDVDYNPTLAADYPELHGVPYSGKYDAEWENELNAARGRDWWATDEQKERLKAYRAQQRAYAKAKGDDRQDF